MLKTLAATLEQLPEARAAATGVQFSYGAGQVDVLHISGGGSEAESVSY